MAKKAVLKAPPLRPAATADAFVSGDSKPLVKRLTVDLSPEAHRAFKAYAATEGRGMVDLLREWIEQKINVPATPSK